MLYAKYGFPMINAARHCTLLDSAWEMKYLIGKECFNKSNHLQQIALFSYCMILKKKTFGLSFYLVFFPKVICSLHLLPTQICVGFLCRSAGLSSDQMPQPPHLPVAFKPITAPKLKFSEGLSLISWCNSLLARLSKLFYIPLVLLAWWCGHVCFCPEAVSE